MVVSLPHDVLLDILFRVDDAAALFRCAAACRQWHDLITDPTTLRRRWPENGCPSLAGFFIKNRARDQGSKVLVPTPGSALGHRCRSLSSFVPTVPDHAVPLSSRRGLLVVRLVPPHEADLDNKVLRLAVCNLILGTCDELPPLMRTTCRNTSIGYSDYGRHCCAVLSGDDCHRSSDDDDEEEPPGNNSPFYTVLIMTAGYESELIRFDVHAFSKGAPRWTTKRSTENFCVQTNALGLGLFCQTDAVVRHGVAHWLFRHDAAGAVQQFCLVQLDDHNGHLMFMWPPFPSMRDPAHDHRMYLSMSIDGALLAVQHTSSWLQIWRHEGHQETPYRNSRWVKSPRQIELIPPMNKSNAQGNGTLYILGEKYGTLLVMNGRGNLYTADLETGAMKEVADGPHVHPNSPLDAVVLEMDWPAFFLSRLGTGSVQQREGNTREEVVARPTAKSRQQIEKSI